MAKRVFGMNQSLDGYVDHLGFAPSPTLFRHFVQEAQRQAGNVYGRQMYELMRYWDDDHLHPVVLGRGKPYFAGPRPPLRLMAYDRIDENVLRLTYVPA